MKDATKKMAETIQTLDDAGMRATAPDARGRP
jgi:hypothetical protein